MNNLELQAYRKRLMLEVREAAKFVGNVSPRSWQYWEQGKYKIPTNVAEEMINLIDIQNRIIDIIANGLKDNNITRSLPWYLSYDDFLMDFPERNEIAWRLYQSVVANFFANGKCEQLSHDTIDKKEYLHFIFATLIS